MLFCQHSGERTRAHYSTTCSSVLRPIAPAPLFSLGLHTPLFLSRFLFLSLLLLVANGVHMQVAQLYPSNSLKRIVSMFRAISGHVMTRRTAFTIERTCHHPTRPVCQCPSSPGAGDNHNIPHATETYAEARQPCTSQRKQARVRARDTLDLRLPGFKVTSGEWVLQPSATQARHTNQATRDRRARTSIRGTQVQQVLLHHTVAAIFGRRGSSLEQRRPGLRADTAAGAARTRGGSRYGAFTFGKESLLVKHGDGI